MKMLVCGNFSRGLAAVNGQTIKTRALAGALTDAHGDHAVVELDTSTVFRRPAVFYSSAREGFMACTHVLLLPGPLAVHVLVPLFARWRAQQRKDVRYVVIGGFLPDYVAR